MNKLEFSDLEQDIILIAKQHNFTDEFLKEQDLNTIDFIKKEVTRLDKLILLHKKYYDWAENKYYLSVIYSNLLEICFKFYEYRKETKFNIKYYLEDIRKDFTTYEYKNTFGLRHLINNMLSCISDTSVLDDNGEEIFELKGKYVEED